MDEVEKLRMALQQPIFRRAFYDDPAKAMAEQEIDPNQIPDGLLATLRGLSVAELGLIARVTNELELRGLADDERMLRMPL